MAKENDLKEELLKQIDKDSVEVVDISGNSAGKIIKKHQAQLRKLKWITVISWLVTILYFMAMNFLKSNRMYLTGNESWLVHRSDTGLKVLIVIAVLLTFSIYSKSRTLTIRQIYVRLINIEEYLKKMSQDK
jgi:cytochrome b subunit of formate dehydrogenase